MMKNIASLRLFVVFVCFFTALSSIPGQQNNNQVAYLNIENSHFDSRYDYLKGMIEGILLFDLSRAPGIGIVERSDLERVLEEQELQLSGITEEDNKAAEVGKILGADYLLKGNYIFLGEDLLINISLLDVETSQSINFAERGYTENTIHALAEEIVFRLTDKEVSLQSEDAERSIVSLRDESPGSIALYSRLIDARIYLDDEFVGYTSGDWKVPYEIEGVKPGKHTVRTHLSGGFGVIKLPEVTFHDWSEEIEVKPGKRLVVEDESRDFNSILYGLQNLLYESVNQQADETEEWEESYRVSFTDRQGEEIDIQLSLGLAPSGTKREVRADLVYENQPHSFSLVSEKEKEVMLEEEVGIVTLKLRLSHRYDRFDLSYYLFRNDIYQGMWRK